ncbi:flagellar hook-length control protein FliK [Actinoplanes sp. KI2]|uniref:flagellar hook-length control protein FliK n=1 Tax=Actinoplanes sp. KI2 TaxID=2983315 RepID=UPI0021D5CD56|nr:flagellar hook-length control protein FliK [Actinoplanes sp. KI2]MCU7727121.1 flagellar hook-length control protein FliK [Actinoplanes sp. KI2]
MSSSVTGPDRAGMADAGRRGTDRRADGGDDFGSALSAELSRPGRDDSAAATAKAADARAADARATDARIAADRAASKVAANRAAADRAASKVAANRAADRAAARRADQAEDDEVRAKAAARERSEAAEATDDTGRTDPTEGKVETDQKADRQAEGGTAPVEAKAAGETAPSVTTPGLAVAAMPVATPSSIPVATAPAPSPTPNAPGAAVSGVAPAAAGATALPGEPNAPAQPGSSGTPVAAGQPAGPGTVTPGTATPADSAYAAAAAAGTTGPVVRDAAGKPVATQDARADTDKAGAPVTEAKLAQQPTTAMAVAKPDPAAESTPQPPSTPVTPDAKATSPDTTGAATPDAAKATAVTPAPGAADQPASTPDATHRASDATTPPPTGQIPAATPAVAVDGTAAPGVLGQAGLAGVTGPQPTAPAAPAAAPAPASTTASPTPPPAAQMAMRIAPLRLEADGVHRLTVHLHPVDLGPVQVVAEVRNGDISLQLTGTTDAGTDALRNALGDLRRELADSGFANCTLDLRQGTAQQERARQQFAETGYAGGRRDSATADSTASAEPSRTVRRTPGSSRLDVHA